MGWVIAGWWRLLRRIPRLRRLRVAHTCGRDHGKEGEGHEAKGSHRGRHAARIAVVRRGTLRIRERSRRPDELTDAGTRGRGDAGTRGRGDARTRGREDARRRGSAVGVPLSWQSSPMRVARLACIATSALFAWGPRPPSEAEATASLKAHQPSLWASSERSQRRSERRRCLPRCLQGARTYCQMPDDAGRAKGGSPA